MVGGRIGATLDCHAGKPIDGRERAPTWCLYADVRTPSVLFPENAYKHMSKYIIIIIVELTVIQHYRV